MYLTGISRRPYENWKRTNRSGAELIPIGFITGAAYLEKSALLGLPRFQIRKLRTLHAPS
jgi:hypothetical protein